MSEEAATGGVSEATATESPEGQGSEGGGEPSVSTEGQGSVDSPEKGQEQTAPKGDDKGESDQKPQWDAETTRWMQSKGWDTTAYDPSNKAHSDMIASHRQLEREFHDKRQSERSKEVLERARATQPKAKASQEQELTPTQVVEQDHQAVLQYTLRTLGLQSVGELQVQRPDIYAQMQSEYDSARFAAFKEEMLGETKKQQAERQKAEEEQRYRDDFDAARRQSDSVIAQLKQKNPHYDEHMKNSGVDQVLQTLEETHMLWRELLFTNPKLAEFFSEAAEAIEYRKSEPARLEEWKQNYEKNKLELAKAQGPRPAGSGNAPHPAFVGNGSWDKTLESVSKPFKM